MKNLQLQDISIAFGARQCLDRVSLNFPYGEKIALCGANGSGKTTLMKIVAGLLAADSGSIVKSREAVVVYLPQGNVTYGDATLAEEARRAFAAQETWLEESRRLEVEISGLPAGSPRLEPSLELHHALQEKLERSGFFTRDKRTAQVLGGLGFAEHDFAKPASSFSLGWQMRLALAKVLLQDPDFLLLDEPTNYLDLEARAWLLEFFRKFQGGILVVSHDRYFLDSTVNAVAELFMGKLRVYRGNYTDYETVRSREMEALVEKARQVEEERERIEVFIRRFRYQASRASLVQSRIKQLEKLEPVEIPPGAKKIHFTFPPPPAGGKRALLVEGLAKSYDGVEVFRGIGFEASRGEKIVVVGPNGAGKSTLLRLLAAREAADGGRVVYDERTAVGYFSSEVSLAGDGSATVFQTVEAVAPPSLYPKLRTLLGAFLFGGDDAFKPVRVLSGGEQSRLLLLTLLLKPSNLLILDEPTNHLDLASQEVLLDALRRFPGTILFVSHDRSFIEGLAEKVLEMGGRKAVMYNGDYRYYLWKKENAAAQQAAAEPARAERKNEDDGAERGKSSHEDSKRLRNAVKKLEREEAGLLEAIENLHRERRALESSLAEERVYRDGELVRRAKERLNRNRSEETALFERWQALEEEKNALSGGD
jgi:ATP-binding cassette subfamily F protein 3